MSLLKNQFSWLALVVILVVLFVLIIGWQINSCFAQAVAHCGGEVKTTAVSWGIFCDFSCG